MTPADRLPFLEIIIGFAELRGKQLSAPALELYWNSMQDWSLVDFRVAANRLLRTCQWMPLPHHFEELRKAGRPTAGEAWAVALDWARSGAYRHPAQSSEAIEVDRVVRALGGWVVVTQCNEDKLTFLEKRFCEHYEQIEDRQETRKAVPQITNRVSARISDAAKRLQAQA